MKFYTVLLSSLITLTAVSQDVLEVTSSVNRVAVFPRGAQVERLASKFLSVGSQQVSFTNLSSQLVPSSISVSAGESVNVLSVTTQNNYLKPGEKPKVVKSLQDSLKTYEFDHAFNANMLGVYQEERTMVLANQRVGGDQSEFVIEDLEDLSDFYRDRLADIMLKTMELDAKQKRLNKHITRIRKQLQEHNTRLNMSTGEILVELDVKSNSNVDFKLSYMVSNAGWTPAYNVNVKGVDLPLTVTYNAKVYQNTGVDWNDVNLLLTNANPNLQGDKPVVHPWRLDFIQVQPAFNPYSNKLYESAGAVQSLDVRVDDIEERKSASVEYPVNEASKQFKIKTKQRIPSNGKPRVINIDELEIPAKYQYYTAPKVTPAAYLIARVAKFEQYDLLPGSANLFLGNTYVGQTYINPAVVTDTLDLSLGRDQSIIVKREKIKEFTASKKIGSSTKESLGLKVSVRNTKSTKIKLIIEDQIPISGNKDIEITLDEAKTAKLDPLTGTLRWSKNILSNSTEELVFKYSVKYPSDKKINL
ncbi:MAG: mucoidy inhibitor MuiA family protein [Bacteroidetes bacterium]|nr:mucoidy inhibitor MuiA family protein [Bacteroidota bacterium]